MKRFVLLLMIASTLFAQRGRRPSGLAPADAEHPPMAKGDVERKVLDTLNAIARSGELYANVPAADGRLMRMLAESVNAKHIVEIGTSTGISGLWFCLALEKTGGKLTTFELDKTRANTARKHFAEAGVTQRVTLIEGDAHVNIAKLKEPIDIVFIDADKEGYPDYLQKLLPLLRPGGLILAHNSDMIPDYLKAVYANPDLDTVIYTGGGGLAVTLKKR